MLSFDDWNKIALVRKAPPRPSPWIQVGLRLEPLEKRELLTLSFDPDFHFSEAPETEQDGHVFVGSDESEASSIALKPNSDNVYLAGIAFPDEPTRSWQVVELDGDTGEPDTGFSGDGIFDEEFFGASLDNLQDIVIDSAERLVLGGFVVPAGTGTRTQFGVMRLDVDGAFDQTFSGDGKVNFAFPGQTASKAFAIDVDDDNRIIIAGHMEVNQTIKCAVARLEPDGDLDSTFDGDGFWTLGRQFMLDS